MSEASRMKLCRNVNCGANPSKKTKDGESSRLSLTTAGSSMNAAFGDVSAGGVGTPLLEVTQSGGGPSASVANQPWGNAGGVTPSKFSLRALRPKHGPHLPVRISALIGRIANRPMPAAMRKRRKPRLRNPVRVNVSFRLASIAAKLQLVFSTEALRPCQ